MRINGAYRMRKFILRTAAPAALASALLVAGGSGTAAAKKTQEECDIDRRVCYRGCNGPAGDLGETCRAKCDLTLISCGGGKGGNKENRPKGSTGAKGDGVAKDPASPPKTARRPFNTEWQGPTSPKAAGAPRPIENKWHGPASPPKATGTWHGPASSPSGSGPILRK